MSTVTTTVSISGMTCSRCVGSVTEELEALDGVPSVSKAGYLVAANEA